LKEINDRNVFKLYLKLLKFSEKVKIPKKELSITKAPQVLGKVKQEINLMASLPNFFSKQEQAIMVTLLNSSHSLSARQIYFSVTVGEIMELHNLVKLIEGGALTSEIESVGLLGVKKLEKIKDPKVLVPKFINDPLLIMSIQDSIIRNFSRMNDEEKLGQLEQWNKFGMRFVSYPTIKKILKELKDKEWVFCEKKGRTKECFISLEFRRFWQDYRSKLMKKIDEFPEKEINKKAPEGGKTR